MIYLLSEQQRIPYSRIAVERQIKPTNKRFDLLIHDQTTGLPKCIIECKARSEPIGQHTLEQISRYNHQLNVPYLIVTNWTNWIAAEVSENGYQFLNEFPKL